ncbi:hypothetical protein WMY93_010107 [Mugilogobius chulae]|uniref:Uncharacterized protein n=1 Tax=Mugilogobius chulae TaxID=88201 RepID=A0AAW0PCP8_9GOBI
MLQESPLIKNTTSLTSGAEREVSGTSESSSPGRGLQEAGRCPRKLRCATEGRAEIAPTSPQTKPQLHCVKSVQLRSVYSALDSCPREEEQIKYFLLHEYSQRLSCPTVRPTRARVRGTVLSETPGPESEGLSCQRHRGCSQRDCPVRDAGAGVRGTVLSEAPEPESEGLSCQRHRGCSQRDCPVRDTGARVRGTVLSEAPEPESEGLSCQRHRGCSQRDCPVRDTGARVRGTVLSETPGL